MKITVNTLSAPESTDPIEFDYYVHHLIFRSVIATLVSTNGSNEVVPYLAESWISTENNKVWSFKISNKFRFQDGAPINPEAVKASLLRLKRILDQKKSNNIITSNLVEDGISAEGNNVILKFSKSIERVPYHLGFGLFGIVSEKDFDNEGHWKNKKSINSSGAYRVDAWNEKSVSIKLKPDYEFVGSKSKISDINFVWDPGVQADLISGSSDDVIEGYKFIGQVYSGFMYFHLFSWSDPSSPLYKKENRVAFRDYVRSYYSKAGFPLANSLFPVSSYVPPRLEVSAEKPSFFNKNSLKIANSPSIRTNRSKVLARLLNESGIESTSVQWKDFANLLDPEIAPKTTDIRLSGSSIHLDEPIDDLKFMFNSKEGIRLPDPTGLIRKHLEMSDIDVDYVEKLIHEDAIIIPVVHDAAGIWHKTDLDFSKVSTIQLPIDFLWVSTGD